MFKPNLYCVVPLYPTGSKSGDIVPTQPPGCATRISKPNDGLPDSLYSVHIHLHVAIQQVKDSFEYDG